MNISASSSKNRMFRIYGVSVLAVLILIAALLATRPWSTSSGRPSAGGKVAAALINRNSSHAPRRYHADHATFSAVNDLAAAASNVVYGTVESSQPGESTSLGVDPSTGTALPALPHTDFLVLVGKSIKGSISSGSQITVTLAGGITDTGPVTVDGVPTLPFGTNLLFFLNAGNDGKYYPLAGGSAIAAETTSGQFVLPDDVTGISTLAFSTADILKPPEAIHVVVTTTQPIINLNGPLQSGGIVRTVTSTGSSLTGDALINGSDVSLTITIAGASASGSFSVDGVQFTIIKGQSVGTTKTVAHITAQVSAINSHSKRFTAQADLLVSTN
jgi:hypothetical protein